MEKTKTKTKKFQIEDIKNIIKSIDLINTYYNIENINNKDMLLITKNDSKLFHFIFLYLFKSLKYKEFLNIFRLKEKEIMTILAIILKFPQQILKIWFKNL